MESILNTPVPITQVDNISKSSDKKNGKAFGVTVVETYGESMVSDRSIDSIIFKEKDGFVMITPDFNKHRMENEEIFAGTYNARPVKNPDGSLYSRVCTKVGYFVEGIAQVFVGSDSENEPLHPENLYLSLSAPPIEPLS